jgi:hypothetical protein
VEVRSTLPNWIRIFLFILIFAVLAMLLYVNYRFVQEEPGGNDFLSRWMGAKSWLVDGLSPYDPEVSLRSQEVIYGRPARPEDGEDIAHFVYPLPAMIFFGPFGLLPYNEARTIWMTILEICLPLLTWMGISIARWKPSRSLLVLLVAFSIIWYHGFRAVILGQFAIIEAVLIAGGLLSIQREQDGIAGILLALSIAKPQMSFLLLPFVILWAISRRRWILVLSTLGSIILLIGISVLLLPGWILDWIQQVLSYPGYTETVLPPVEIVANLFPTISTWIIWLGTGIFILYLLWEWFLAFRKDDPWFQWTAAMTVLITNLIVFRTATTNYLAMVPGMMIVFSVIVDRWQKRGAITVAILLLVLLVGLWALFILTVDGNLENPVMYMPLPIFMLLSLWWIRWWYIRPTRLPLETTIPS